MLAEFKGLIDHVKRSQNGPPPFIEGMPYPQRYANPGNLLDRYHQSRG